MTMLKPICVACRRFFRPERNGLYFVEGMPLGENVPSGHSHPELWAPYKLWMGDLWKCHGCGHIIICGTGHQPISTQHMSDFNQKIKLSGAELQINDC